MGTKATLHLIESDEHSFCGTTTFYNKQTEEREEYRLRIDVLWFYRCENCGFLWFSGDELNEGEKCHDELYELTDCPHCKEHFDEIEDILDVV